MLEERKREGERGRDRKREEEKGRERKRERGLEGAQKNEIEGEVEKIGIEDMDG